MKHAFNPSRREELRSVVCRVQPFLITVSTNQKRSKPLATNSIMHTDAAALTTLRRYLHFPPSPIDSTPRAALRSIKEDTSLLVRRTSSHNVHRVKQPFISSSTFSRVYSCYLLCTALYSKRKADNLNTSRTEGNMSGK